MTNEVLVIGHSDLRFIRTCAEKSYYHLPPAFDPTGFILAAGGMMPKTPKIGSFAICVLASVI